MSKSRVRVSQVRNLAKGMMSRSISLLRYILKEVETTRDERLAISEVLDILQKDIYDNWDKRSERIVKEA